jgi:hypothetical protein
MILCWPTFMGQQVEPVLTRGKQGSKFHLLVDARGAPLAVYVSGANQHDKWGAAELVVSIVVARPKSKQHFCADRGYDYPDVHEVIAEEQYIAHIKHRRRRGEPVLEACPAPGGKNLSRSKMGGGKDIGLVL